MPIDKWDEAGKAWEDDHGLLDDDQIAKCARADAAEPLRSPIPTRMISNGEYMPIPQTEQQQRVEARIEDLTESASKKLGVDRRAFLASTGGMAAALLAMNEVFGRFFNVDPIEMFEPVAYAQADGRRALRDGVPDIKWTTEYAQLVAPFSNCYAEIGTTWGSSVVTFPTVAAHIMGQLMRYLGEDRIVFGSDCVWYGSPQWQNRRAVAVSDPGRAQNAHGIPRLHG